MPDEEEVANIIAIRVIHRPPPSMDRDPVQTRDWHARGMELKPGASISAEQLLVLLYETRRDYGPTAVVQLRLITESESEAPYWRAFGEWIQREREREAAADA